MTQKLPYVNTFNIFKTARMCCMEIMFGTSVLRLPCVTNFKIESLCSISPVIHSTNVFVVVWFSPKHFQPWTSTKDGTELNRWSKHISRHGCQADINQQSVLSWNTWHGLYPSIVHVNHDSCLLQAKKLRKRH